MSSPANRSASTSLHQRIRSDIERRILAGQWGPGHKIPFEHEIMAQYGCARMTVSKAITSLVAEGFIVRNRRGGSFVAQPRIHSAVLEIPDIQADITSRGLKYGLRLLLRKQRKPAAQHDMEKTLAGKGELLAVRCVHLADEKSFAFEDRLISLAAVPEAATVDFSLQSPGSWLLGHAPWTEAEHRISAINADRRMSRELTVAVGEACLVLERRTWRGLEHITHVRQVFPGPLFDLVARFAPKNSVAQSARNTCWPPHPR